MKSIAIPVRGTHRMSFEKVLGAILIASGLSLPFPALAQVNPYTSIGLEWTAGGDDGTQGQATVYEMRYSTSAPGASDSLTVLGWWNNATPATSLPAPKTSGSADSTRVTGLTPGATYYFVLRSRDDGYNTSPFSNIATAATLSCDPPPSAPGSFSATADTGLVDLSWSGPDPGANALNVYRGNGSNPPTSLLVSLPPGATSYQDTGVQPGTTYTYRVAWTITCSGGPYSTTVVGPYSGSSTVTLPGNPPTPGASAGAASVHAYPNPSSGPVQFVFRLEGNVARDAHVRLYDMAGHWIATIVERRLNPGEQTISWPRTDRNGRQVTPGYYEAVGTVGDTRVRERVVLTP